ncbi:MAG: flavodoxin family protein [Candidatus Alcyoniella australis]|nr:flavodoxin family protein [Candidatus Alcyoniella australis]
MKVIAFNSSPHKDGNTAQALKVVCEQLEQHGVTTELVHLYPMGLRGCCACMKCKEAQDRCCHGPQDGINGLIEKMLEADGMLLGSPVYFSGMNPELKALIDRAGMVTRANGHLLKRKLGAAVVALRRQGALPTFDGINHFFLVSQMIVPGSSYWNMVLGGAPGEMRNDEEGLDTLRTLGENMAWLLKRLQD